MSTIIKKEGYPYSFNQDTCATYKGKCCAGKNGYINVSKNEIFKILALLKLSVNDFGIKYLFKHSYKYSIKEVQNKGSYESIFYDRENSACKIYKERPSECITFPFWDYFKTHVDESKEEYPGIVDD